MRIGPNVYAEVDYVLEGEDGEVLDDSSAEDGEPLRYVHGYGMLVPGLEKRLQDLSEGDHADIVVPAEEAYGLYDEEIVYTLERSAAQNAVEGDEVTLEDADGEERVVFVTEVGDEEVVVDGNHPLAGLTLRYRVTVRVVRTATTDEIERAAEAFDRAREENEPREAPTQSHDLVPLFSLTRHRKLDPPS